MKVNRSGEPGWRLGPPNRGTESIYNGRFDASVSWRPDGATPEQLAAIPADRRPPDVNLFEAFEQQAGLRLEARREPVEALVIDHIEQADPN